MSSRIGPVGLIIGPLFLAAGIALAIFLSEISTLKCERVTAAQADCVLIGAKPFRRTTRTDLSNELQQADLIRYRNTDADDTYVIVLKVADDWISFTDVKSSGFRRKRRNVDRINDFLGDPNQINLEVVQDERWFAFGLGGLFAVVGLCLIVAGGVALF